MDKKIPLEILDKLEFKTFANEEAAGPQLVKVHHEAKPCEDCGKIVENRRLRLSVNRSSLSTHHIKYQCQNCKLYKNPTTGVFDMTFKDINRHFYVGYRKKR